MARLKMFMAQPNGSAGNGNASKEGGRWTTSDTREKSYSANACDDSIATRSPVTNSVTPAPVASMRPHASWPGAPVSNGYSNHGFPSQSGRFEAQTPQPSILTRTSPAPGSRNSSSCTPIFRGLEMTAARPSTARGSEDVLTSTVYCTLGFLKTFYRIQMTNGINM